MKIWVRFKKFLNLNVATLQTILPYEILEFNFDLKFLWKLVIFPLWKSYEV